jgi:hypothetical protein
MQPNTGHSIETPEHQNWTYFSESEIFGLLTLHYIPPYQPLSSFVVSFEMKNLFDFHFFLTELSFCFFAEI